MNSFGLRQHLLNDEMIEDVSGNRFTSKVLEQAPIADLDTLNDFDPASDTVAHVALVDTTTANTDMRGTDGANTVAPDNAGIANILADTDELQQNQGDWLTADLSGLATEAKQDIAQTTLDALQSYNEDYREEVSTGEFSGEWRFYEDNTKAVQTAVFAFTVDEDSGRILTIDKTV